MCKKITDAQKLSLPPRRIANGVPVTFVSVKRKIKRGQRHTLFTGTSSEGGKKGNYISRSVSTD